MRMAGCLMKMLAKAEAEENRVESDGRVFHYDQMSIVESLGMQWYLVLHLRSFIKHCSSE